jgi:hypothetical protein
MNSNDHLIPDRNKRIGELGEKFIQQRLDCGIEFDKAWDEWSELERKLQFMIVECPEVRDYDDRRINDRDDRARMRRKAQAQIGEWVRSDDVSCLATAAMALGLRKPTRPYSMDRAIVRNWMETVVDHLEQVGGYTETVAEARQEIDDDLVESYSHVMEEFAEEHALWAVPPSELVWLYHNHMVSEAESEHQ